MEIKTITIVGGGSSGWMTAAALAKCTANIKITLIESDNIPILGVGESTLSQIHEYLTMIGVKDKEWMPKCNAVYKTAIRFSNLYLNGSHYNDILAEGPGKSSTYTVDDFVHLTKIFPDQFAISDFSRFFDDTHSMVEKNKFTNNADGILRWNIKTEKAYHFDAYMFGQTLKDLVALPNGVHHVVDDVTDIVVNDDNSIKSLTTMNNGEIISDLYIDCTGFEALLIGKKQDVKFYDFSDQLLNDRAVVANIPYVDKNVELESWTDCRAMNSGWLWNIPIWDRIGTGYVYSSKYITDDEALKEFKQELEKKYGTRVQNITPKFIKFKPGVREKSWFKNTVAIGLSGGFLEPLRSTGLLVTHTAIIKLVDALTRNNNVIKNIDKEIFSAEMVDCLQGFKEFVLAQYVFARKIDTPYWSAASNINFGKDSSWVRNLSNINRNRHYLNNREAVNIRLLTGSNYNYIPERVNVTEEEKERLVKILNSWQKRKASIDNYIDTLPSFYEFLQKEIYNE